MASRKEGVINYGKTIKDAIHQGKDVITALVNPNPSTLINGVTSMVKSFGTAFNGLKALKDIIFNHPEWYENYDTKGMISLNLGLNKGLTSRVTGGIDARATTPALAVSLVLTPVIPDNLSHDFDTGINIIYNRLRSANSGSINYSVNALKAYIMHLNQCHAFYAMLRRLYATLNNVNPYDSTLPEVLIRASGFNYNNVSQFAAQIREYGAKFALKLANSGPGHLNLFDRTRWLYSNYFADSNDIKASYYCFVPDRILDFDFTNNSINQNVLNVGNMDTTTMFVYGNSLINTLITTREYNIIAGDMLKAFGAEAIYPAEVWDVDMPTPLIYDEAALTQIQNAMICGGDATYTLNATTCSSVYTGSGNYIVGNNDVAQFIRDYLNRTRPVNFYKDSVTPGEIMSATSFCPAVAATIEINSLPSFVINASGAEVLTRMFCWSRNDSSGIVSNVTIGDPSFEAGTGEIAELARRVTVWSNMDYMPYMAIPGVADSRYEEWIGHLFDWNTYALVNDYQLDNMRGFASMSLVAVPFIKRQTDLDLNLNKSKSNSKSKKKSTSKDKNPKDMKPKDTGSTKEVTDK